VVVSAGLGSLLLSVPVLLPVMRWAGAAWMLWLAWKIATALPPGEGVRRPLMGVPGAAAFQWINPKAWLIAVAAASEYTLPDQPLGSQLLRIGLIFLAVGFPCMLPWTMLGSGAGRLLRSPAQLRAFNVTMALLLVLSLIPVLLER
jgi:threonine/homoserine/homoserine lactone efflux protein